MWLCTADVEVCKSSRTERLSEGACWTHQEEVSTTGKLLSLFLHRLTVKLLRLLLCVRVCHGTVWRRHLYGLTSFLPPLYEFQGLNSGPPSLPSKPSPTEPSHQPMIGFILSGLKGKYYVCTLYCGERQRPIVLVLANEETCHGPDLTC